MAPPCEWRVTYSGVEAAAEWQTATPFPAAEAVVRRWEGASW